MITTKGRRRVAAMVLLATIAAGTPARAAAPPAVAPPTAHPNGASYAEWSARWWQWAFGTAVTPGGPFDEGSIDCGADQPEEHVWFLAGPFNVSGTEPRRCVVPPGTKLLVPVINVECSDREEPPFFGATPAERADCVNADLFALSDLELTIDDRAVPNLEDFVVTSPDFQFHGVPGNPVGVVGDGSSTSRGVFVMLNPLPPGEYVLSFTGSFPAVGFTAAATYELVVAPR
jgi:hypothetical protein